MVPSLLYSAATLHCAPGLRSLRICKMIVICAGIPSTVSSFAMSHQILFAEPIADFLRTLLPQPRRSQAAWEPAMLQKICSAGEIPDSVHVIDELVSGASVAAIEFLQCGFD